MGFISVFFNVVLVDPMINILVMLYILCSENFGLAIIVFTLIVRGALTPLSVRQSKQFKAMGALQPKLKSLQEKYKNDRSRVSSETMKLYRENGVSPLGCLGPTFLQMPVFFALFWALRGTLPSTPENLTKLSDKLYSWLPGINQAIPIDDNFLGLSLGKITTDNPLPYLLPILVGISTFFMQKSSSPPSSPQQESTNRMLLWMMPGMLGYFTLFFETGLALYWIVSNVVGIIIQGFVVGWSPILSIFSRSKSKDETESTQEDKQNLNGEENSDEVSGNDSKNGGRSDRNSVKRIKRRAQRSKNRRNR
ncbi:MAG: membrane protein insertase YidC [Dehalococcoidia bacterium]